MTNAEIIERAQRNAGVTETCHTYGHWKTLGFQVKKGSKALFSATIWKAAAKKRKADEEPKPEEVSMFMKTASFFGASQVEPIGV